MSKFIKHVASKSKRTKVKHQIGSKIVCLQIQKLTGEVPLRQSTRVCDLESQTE